MDNIKDIIRSLVVSACDSNAELFLIKAWKDEKQRFIFQIYVNNTSFLDHLNDNFFAAATGYTKKDSAPFSNFKDLNIRNVNSCLVSIIQFVEFIYPENRSEESEEYFEDIDNLENGLYLTFIDIEHDDTSLFKQKNMQSFLDECLESYNKKTSLSVVSDMPDRTGTLIFKIDHDNFKYFFRK